MGKERETGWNEEGVERAKEYKKRMYEKMDTLGMTEREYELFTLQGIKKELMLMRGILNRIENKGKNEREEY